MTRAWYEVHGITFWPVFDPTYLRRQRTLAGLARRIAPRSVYDVPPQPPLGWRRIGDGRYFGVLILPLWLAWPILAWRRLRRLA